MRVPLRAARCHQGAFRLISVDVDEADGNARERLAALHAHGICQHPAAVAQMAAVAPCKSAGDLDILYGIVVVVPEREGDQRLRAEPAATPSLRRYSQPF